MNITRGNNNTSLEINVDKNNIIKVEITDKGGDDRRLELKLEYNHNPLSKASLDKIESLKIVEDDELIFKAALLLLAEKFKGDFITYIQLAYTVSSSYFYLEGDKEYVHINKYFCPYSMFPLEEVLLDLESCLDILSKLFFNLRFKELIETVQMKERSKIIKDGEYDYHEDGCNLFFSLKDEPWVINLYLGSWGSYEVALEKR